MKTEPVIKLYWFQVVSKSNTITPRGTKSAIRRVRAHSLEYAESVALEQVAKRGDACWEHTTNLLKITD